MSKITVIQLLNKIANGEEVPKKIKYDDYIWEWSGGITYINNIKKDLFKEYLDMIIIESLNDEVKIIEEQEDINIQDIEEITYKGEKIRYGSTKQFTDDVDDYCPAINSILDSVGIKINEIIRAVKHLEKTKEDK